MRHSCRSYFVCVYLDARNDWLIYCKSLSCLFNGTEIDLYFLFFILYFAPSFNLAQKMPSATVPKWQLPCWQSWKPASNNDLHQKQNKKVRNINIQQTYNCEKQGALNITQQRHKNRNRCKRKKSSDACAISRLTAISILILILMGVALLPLLL